MQKKKYVVDAIVVAVMMQKPLKLLYCGCNCSCGQKFKTILFICIQEEWRVEMPPIQCFILKVQPKVDVRLRIKSNGEDYPPHIPHHISKILELHFVSTFIGIYLNFCNLFLLISLCDIILISFLDRV